MPKTGEKSHVRRGSPNQTDPTCEELIPQSIQSHLNLEIDEIMENLKENSDHYG